MSYTARAVRQAFGPTVGGQSKLATPGQKRTLLPSRRIPFGCPEQTPTPALGETLLGIAGTNLYTITIDVDPGDALIYRYSISTLLTGDGTPAETITAEAMFDYVNFDYMGQGVLDRSGNLLQWRWNGTDYELQRWIRDGSTYVLDVSAITAEYNWFLGQSYNPIDRFLYLYQFISSTGDGYPPIRLRRVQPTSGAASDFSDDDLVDDQVPQIGTSVTPVFTVDGSVWVWWEDAGGLEGGFWHVAPNGTTSLYSFPGLFFFPFGLPYHRGRMLIVDRNDFVPYLLDRSGTLTEATGDGCLAFAAGVESTFSYNFEHRVIYGAGYAWVFLADSAQLWRSPFSR